MRLGRKIFGRNTLGAILGIAATLQLLLPAVALAQNRQYNTTKAIVVDANGNALNPLPVTASGNVAVTPTTTLISPANGFQVPSAGFVGPEYAATSVTDSTGWDISQCGQVVVSFEGTYAGTAVFHEQTLDATGVTGWFPIGGVQLNNNGSGVTDMTAGALLVGSGYVYPGAGMRQRMRITALTSGTLIARVMCSQRPMMRVAALAQGPVAPNTAPGGSVGIVRVGVVARTSNLAAQTSGVLTDPTATAIGVPVEKPFSIPELDWLYAAASGGITDTANYQVIAAQATGIRNYVTRLNCKNASASVATEFVVKDGTTTVMDREHLGAGDRVAVSFPTPLRGSAATAVNIAAITTGAQIYCNIGGYGAP